MTADKLRTSPIAKRPGRPAKHQTRNSMGMTKNVSIAIGFMVNEGLPRREAAERAGISDSALYQAFRKPEVVRHYNIEIEALRTMERARNMHALIEVRERGMLPDAPAAASRATVEAVKVLEGERQGSGINLAVGANISPGYIIDCTEALSREPYQDEVIRIPVPSGGFQQVDDD